MPQTGCSALLSSRSADTRSGLHLPFLAEAKHETLVQRCLLYRRKKQAYLTKQEVKAGKKSARTELELFKDPFSSSSLPGMAVTCRSVTWEYKHSGLVTFVGFCVYGNTILRLLC